MQDAKLKSEQAHALIKQDQVILHSKKMLGCFNPNLGQIWKNPNVGLNLNKQPSIFLECMFKIDIDK